MRRCAIVIALFSISACLFSATADASMARPIVYSKTSWEWTGPEGERHIVTRGGLFAARDDLKHQLTTDPRDQQPSVSRDGSTIVFVRGGDLYAMAADGSGQRQLTNGSEFDELPQVSPDGSLVLFIRRADMQAPGDLYTVPLGGGAPHALAPYPGEDREASFSAEGKAIVFVRGLPVSGSAEINEELFSVRPDGSGLARLTRTSNDESRPHYFAKGIVFNRRKSASGGRTGIYAMRRNGTRVKAVLTWKSRFQGLIQAVSPNGRLLVLSTTGTWVKRLVGPTRRSLRPRRLAGWTAEHLVFSPDGRMVAGAFANNSSEVAPFYVLSSIDVFTGFGQAVGESWEPEEPGPIQTSVGSWIAW
jgi:dipeptidyl aminopeptidase/acylaminoacyl peptidase